MLRGLVEKKTYVPAKRFLINLVKSPAAIAHQIFPTPNLDAQLVFVLSFPRSGTTALASIFTRPEAQLDYHGEFFAFNAWTRENERLSWKYPFFTTVYHRNFVKQKKSWKNYRYESSVLDPVRTIRAWMQIPGVHVIKVFPNQISDEHLGQIIAKYRPAVVFLRRNHLDRMVSNMKANQSGTWHNKSTEEQRVDVDFAALEKTKKEHEDFYKKFKSRVVKNGCEFVDVDYSEVFKPENVASILDLICPETASIRGAQPPSPSTKKQDTSTINQDNFFAKIAAQGIKRKKSDYDFALFEATDAR
jgi:hypothetical protein